MASMTSGRVARVRFCDNAAAWVVPMVASLLRPAPFNKTQMGLVRSGIWCRRCLGAVRSPFGQALAIVRLECPVLDGRIPSEHDVKVRTQRDALLLEGGKGTITESRHNDRIAPLRASFSGT